MRPSNPSYLWVQSKERTSVAQDQPLHQNAVALAPDPVLGIQQIFSKYAEKVLAHAACRVSRSSLCDARGLAASWEHRNIGVIPHLAQWVKEPVLPQLWLRLKPRHRLDLIPGPGTPYAAGHKKKKKKKKKKQTSIQRLIVPLQYLQYCGKCISFAVRLMLF